MQLTFSTVLILVLIIIICFGLKHSKLGNTNRETPWLFFMGAFVWADAVVLGIFWLMAIGISLLFNDWLLFWLIYAVFWIVRSFGEINYWLNEQFASEHRNPPKKFWFYKFFPNESVWFVLQLYWQCVMVLSIIGSVYLFSLWLPKIK